MATPTETLDLSRLGLAFGEARRLDLQVPVEQFSYGGEDYAAGESGVDARLDVSRTSGGGYALRMRFRAHLSGACMRCLEDADPWFDVDAREVQQPGGGDDLESPYVEEERLDLRAWARDALALALPQTILCRDDCAGLCPVCGENLNTVAPGHAHEREPDRRWAKLSEIKFE
jgi:uncharacterized protein